MKIYRCYEIHGWSTKIKDFPTRQKAEKFMTTHPAIQCVVELESEKLI
jgi:hypothetical protein